MGGPLFVGRYGALTSPFLKSGFAADQSWSGAAQKVK